MDSLCASFWFEIVLMCLTNHSNLNVDDQGVIHLQDGRLFWLKMDVHNVGISRFIGTCSARIIQLRRRLVAFNILEDRAA